jgi:hypothetical protein
VPLRGPPLSEDTKRLFTVDAIETVVALSDPTVILVRALQEPVSEVIVLVEPEI